MKRHLLIVALALASISCCPSLWLTVTKGDPAPRPTMPPRELAPLAIPTPAHYTSRLDRLVDGGQPLAEFSFEAPDQKSAATRSAFLASTGDNFGSFLGVREIRRAWGIPSAPAAVTTRLPSPAVRGIFKFCDIEPTCRRLTIQQPLPVPEAAAVAITITSSEPAKDVQDCPLVTAKGDLHTYLCPIIFCEPIAEHGPLPPGCRRPNAAGDVNVVLGKGLRGVKTDSYAELRFFETPPTAGAWAQTLFTFFHITDMQLRDPDVRVGDRKLSHQLDWLIQSFEYDQDMEFYDRYVVEALFETMNAALDPKLYDDPRDKPLFVIHTGDSIDSGLTSELRLAHRLIDRVQIPFFNLVGNHDTLTFGNLIPVANRNNDQECATISSVANGQADFINKWPFYFYHHNSLCIDEEVACPHCLPGEAVLVAKGGADKARQTFLEGFKHSDSDVLRQLEDDDFSCKTISHKPTFQHGFDLTKGLPGYYAFSQSVTIGDSGKKQHAIFVVLNTEELAAKQGGTHGHVSATQLDWLADTLACADATDLVLVFGHQPLSVIDLEMSKNHPWKSLDEALSASPNVVAYFYGDKHRHGICRDKGNRPGACSHFWEIETGSLIEFPQEGRQVRLKYAGDGLAFFELTVFRERLDQADHSDFVQAVRLGRRGAERDYCRTAGDIVCSQDLRPYRNDGRHTNGRLFFRLPGY